MKYAILFNSKNLRTSVHACNCTRVAGQTRGLVTYRKGGEHSWQVEAIDAAAAAAEVYEDNDGEARGMAYPKICPCAKV